MRTTSKCGSYFLIKATSRTEPRTLRRLNSPRSKRSHLAERREHANGDLRVGAPINFCRRFDVDVSGGFKVCGSRRKEGSSVPSSRPSPNHVWREGERTDGAEHGRRRRRRRHRGASHRPKQADPAQSARYRRRLLKHKRGLDVGEGREGAHGLRVGRRLRCRAGAE